MRNKHRNDYVANYGEHINYTQINIATSTRPKSHHRQRMRKKLHGRERKPRLLRYCGSCGILDQDKVMRMSDDEIISGLLQVGNYVSQDVKHNVNSICRGLGGIGRRMFGAIRQIVYTAGSALG